MNPLSIMLAFTFLASLVALGGFFLWVGARRLKGQTPLGVASGFRTASVSFYSFLVTLGLLLILQGTLGTYRLIWGA